MFKWLNFGVDAQTIHVFVQVYSLELQVIDIYTQAKFQQFVSNSGAII